MTARRSRTSTAGLVLRQLAASPLPSIALALLVAGAAFLAVAAPRAGADVPRIPFNRTPVGSADGRSPSAAPLLSTKK